jgi:hypothetical protein
LMSPADSPSLPSRPHDRMISGRVPHETTTIKGHIQFFLDKEEREGGNDFRWEGEREGV